MSPYYPLAKRSSLCGGANLLKLSHGRSKSATCKVGLAGRPPKRSSLRGRSKSAKVGLAGWVPPKGHRSVDGAKALSWRPSGDGANKALKLGDILMSTYPPSLASLHDSKYSTPLSLLATSATLCDVRKSRTTTVRTTQPCDEFLP